MRNCIGLTLAVFGLMLSGCGHMDFPAGRAYFDNKAHSPVFHKFSYQSGSNDHSLGRSVYGRSDCKKSEHYSQRNSIKSNKKIP